LFMVDVERPNRMPFRAFEHEPRGALAAQTAHPRTVRVISRAQRSSRWLDRRGLALLFAGASFRRRDFDAPATALLQRHARAMGVRHIPVPIAGRRRGMPRMLTLCACHGWESLYRNRSVF